MPEVRPVQLLAENRRQEAKWAEVEGQKPPEFSLEGIATRVREAWRSGASFDAVRRSDRRWLPYVLFYPANAQEQWLAADKKVVAALLRELHRTPRLIPVTIRQLLLRYPSQLSSFELLRAGLRESLTQRELLALAPWRRRIEAYPLLHADGPALFAGVLFDTTKSAEQVLQDAGFDEELVRGEFMRLAVVSGLAAREADLASGESIDDFEAWLSPAVSRGALRFPQDAHVVAHSVLRPHLRRGIGPSQREQIQRVVVRYLKDPRFDRGLWQRVEPDCVALLKRWMVGETLDGFFRLIAKDALEHHWRFRQAFWGAYFKKGMIHDAWVILGEDARRAARRVWADIPQHASLMGAGDASQSVLLLRIGTLTIAEWSHNGRCRVWRDGVKGAPKFHRAEYDRAELKGRADFEISHMGSTAYSWQLKLADYIRRETQCDVRQTEYRVR